VHTADLYIECHQGLQQYQAPWRVHLPQGGTVRDTQQGTWPMSSLPANRKIVSGSVLNFVVQLNPVDEGCKATVNADKLTVTVTSGQDLIWSTTQCDKVIQTATLVVAKGKQAAVTVPWNGRRSRPGCLPGQPVAKPGTYVVKAEYDGRLSSLQAFQVV